MRAPCIKRAKRRKAVCPKKPHTRAWLFLGNTGGGEAGEKKWLVAAPYECVQDRSRGETNEVMGISITKRAF